MKLDLKELRRVASEATQGKLEIEEHNYHFDVKVVGSKPIVFFAEASNKDDAKHIAAFNPQTALALLDLIEHYKAALQKMVDSSNNMGPGIYLSSQSCIQIAKEALNDG